MFNHFWDISKVATVYIPEAAVWGLFFFFFRVPFQPLVYLFFFRTDSDSTVSFKWFKTIENLSIECTVYCAYIMYTCTFISSSFLIFHPFLHLSKPFGLCFSAFFLAKTWADFSWDFSILPRDHHLTWRTPNHQWAPPNEPWLKKIPRIHLKGEPFLEGEHFLRPKVKLVGGFNPSEK